MKLHLVDRRSCSNSSFTVEHHNFPAFLKVWHYHSEIELVYILKSTGTRFVGDSIANFQPGQLVLLGKNLPHMWLNGPEYYNEESELCAEAIAVHFKMDFLGSEFFQAPELNKVADLLSRGNRGILFHDLEQSTKDMLLELRHTSGVERVATLLSVLNVLSNTTSYELLCSEGFLNSFDQTDTNNLKDVYEYIFKNFTEPIKLETVADIAHMNPAAFSRFFKRVHNKTFTRYLNEIRVGYACKLLIEERQKMIAICFDCGFTNISNFNRQFKVIKGMTPSEFQKMYQKDPVYGAMGKKSISNGS